MMWRRTASFYRGASLPLPDPISAVYYFFYLTIQEKGHTQEEEHVVIIIVLRDVLLVAGRARESGLIMIVPGDYCWRFMFAAWRDFFLVVSFELQSKKEQNSEWKHWRPTVSQVMEAAKSHLLLLGTFKSLLLPLLFSGDGNVETLQFMESAGGNWMMKPSNHQKIL